MKRLLLLGVMASFLFTGCSALTLHGEYVKADRSTFDAIGPEYATYVGNDTALDADQKERRLTLLRSWEVRVQRAEADLATEEGK